MRVLVVEDEPTLNRLITKTLQKEQYSVDSCLDGGEVMDYLLGAEYDCLILDIMLPTLSGLDIVQKLRQKKDRTPVLFLTAKDSIQDRVTGLDVGADDYLVKPFSFEELLARIRALVRRNSEQGTNRYQIANLTLDCDTRQVVRDGVPIELTSKEFSILEYMIRNAGIVLTRDKINQHSWNYEYEGGSNMIDVYIRYLRKKIDEGFSPKLIHTVRGTGYVLKVESGE